MINSWLLSYQEATQHQLAGRIIASCQDYYSWENQEKTISGFLPKHNSLFATANAQCNEWQGKTFYYFSYWPMFCCVAFVHSFWICQRVEYSILLGSKMYK